MSQSQGEPARALEEALSREREEFAQMLHDTVSQSLTGLQFMAGVLARRISQLHPEAAGDMEELKAGIASAAEEARRLECWLQRRATAKAPESTDR